jgi:hypothetical protein
MVVWAYGRGVPRYLEVNLMKSSLVARIAIYGCAVVLAACGAGDRSAPVGPSPAQVQHTITATPASSPEVSMPVTSEGTKPADFKGVFHVDPKPDAEGIIHGESPLGVEFDTCGSRTDADKTLTYLYDWNFDGVADVIGTDATCHQQHNYRAKAGDETIRTNVCVVSGNPRVHGPDTYFSCRSYEISVLASKARVCSTDTLGFFSLPNPISVQAGQTITVVLDAPGAIATQWAGTFNGAPFNISSGSSLVLTGTATDNNGVQWTTASVSGVPDINLITWTIQICP